MGLITIEEERAFLLAQRDGRRSLFRPADKEIAAKEAQSAKRKKEDQIRAEEAKVSGSAAQVWSEEYVSTSSSSEVYTSAMA